MTYSLSDAALSLGQVVGSTIDPRLSEIAWAAWRVRMPERMENALGLRPFAELAEALWDPEQPAVLITQLEGDGRGHVAASLAVGVLGASDVLGERDAAARALEDDLNGLRVRSEREAIADLRHGVSRWAMRVRPATAQRDGVSFPSRFTCFPNSLTLLARVLVRVGVPVTVRLTNLATSLRSDEYDGLVRLSESLETCRAESLSAAATAADLLGRLGGVVFEREVMVSGASRAPTRLDQRRIACCLTASFASTWTATGALCCDGPIARGGFEIEPLDPEAHSAAARLGLPLTVTAADRQLVDLTPLEGLIWGVPCPREPVAGLTVGSSPAD